MATPLPSKAPAPRPAAAANQQPPAIKPVAKEALSRLGQLKRGRLGLPPRCLFYGPEGVGKTSIAVDADALIADIEGGSGELNAVRYPFNPGDPDEFKPRDYNQVVAMLDDLIAHPKHGINALSLDTADALEALIHQHLCVTHKVNSIEKVGGGFAKGYRAAIEELRRFLAKLDLIRAQGVTIIIVAHSVTSTFKNPEGPDYDRFQLKVNDSKGASFAGQLKEWSEIVGFVHFESGAKKLEEDDKRARGWSTGRRLVQLAREAAWDAKWRLTVPMAMEFELDAIHPWAPFADAIERARQAGATGATLADQIMTELNRIGADSFTTAAGRPTSRAQVVEMIETASQSTLARVLSGLVATSTPDLNAPMPMLTPSPAKES